MKELKEYTFDELVEAQKFQTFSMLMKDGGKGFNQGVYMAMDVAIRWYKETHDNT